MTISLVRQKCECDPIVGSSPLLRDAIQLADRFARCDAPVLIIGETGTGKELIAQRIHRLSMRQGPLVPVNCATIRAELAESLLFGHRRGAFSGAIESTVGLFSRAHSGTLFLDEFASLPVPSQGALLRVLETGLVEQLGSGTGRVVSVRVVAAVQCERDGEMPSQLRKDLLERLAVAIIRLPPLRELIQDIGPLSLHFAARHGKHVDAAGIQLLQRQAWPGNIRELKSTIDRAALLDDQTILDARSLQASLRARSGEWPRVDEELTQRQQLEMLREEAGGDGLRLATLLGTSRATMYRRLRAEGLSLRRGGTPGAKSHGVLRQSHES